MYKSLEQFASTPAAANGVANHRGDIDIEMIALHTISINYTSLKDLKPESPPSTASPTFCREIPIKDPLLQHAAWAYLQPMTAERESDDHHCCWRRFHQKLCWLLSCFNDVVLAAFEGWCPDQLRERIRFNLSDDDQLTKEERNKVLKL